MNRSPSARASRTSKEASNATNEQKNSLMTIKSLTLADGRRLRLKVPTPRIKAPSAYAFGIYKAGSTLLNNIVSDATQDSQYVYYSLNDDCFGQGFEVESPRNPLSAEHVKTLQEVFAQPGTMFAGFRRFPEFPLPGIDERRKVLFVRDPRDAIVSHFYSVRYSHKAPAGTSVERQRVELEKSELIDYVQTAGTLDFFRGVYNSYLRLPTHNLLVLRYEDTIFDKRNLVDAVVGHLEIGTPAQARQALAERVDVRPDKEKPGDHVRQVKPGNHREKLPSDVIGKLDKAFGDILDRYGYR